MPDMVAITNMTIINAINNQVDIRERTFRSLHKNTEVIEETANGTSQIYIPVREPKTTDNTEVETNVITNTRRKITADIIDAMYQGKRNFDIV